jgi:hypothetical protein
VVIHRFIISGVTYAAIAERLDQYEAICDRALARLSAIEQPDAVELADDERTAVRRRILQKIRGDS